MRMAASGDLDDVAAAVCLVCDSLGQLLTGTSAVREGVTSQPDGVEVDDGTVSCVTDGC